MAKSEVLTSEELASLARAVESADPIDWGMLSIDEDDAFKLVATYVIDMASRVSAEDRLVTNMACLTALMVENFVLQLHLQSLRATLH